MSSDTQLPVSPQFPYFMGKKFKKVGRYKKSIIRKRMKNWCMEGVLSQQQKMVVENILSIQDYYNLKDHHKLISIILNKKQSHELFSQKKMMISNLFENQKYETDSENKINLFAEKYTFENLVEKFKRPKSFKNNILTGVLLKKMETQVIGSHQTRKSIWMLASGALFSMKNNRGLYQGLVNYPDYPNYYERFIMLDLHRTVKKNDTADQETRALKNVLVAFSRRNPYIGYCQGLNFIAFFLLTMQFSEEQAFWILSSITQTNIPMDYYTNMIGVACDQQIFLDILKFLRPAIVKKFNDVGLDGSVLSIQWFVCLFTSSLPFYLVKIVWDRFLVEGTTAFIKAGLIILTKFQKEMLEAKQFYEIIMLIEQGSKNLQITEQEFNEQFNKYYINSQGLKIARDLYRQFHIKDKLHEKLLNNSVVPKPRRNEDMECKVYWPLCIQSLNQARRNMVEIETWTYRQQSSPKIIHDYLQSKKQKPETLKSTINQAQMAIKPQKPLELDNYVIGRMQHICKTSKMEKEQADRQLQKQKKQIQYLSMILHEEEDCERKKDNIRRMLELSRSMIERKSRDTLEEDGHHNDQVTRYEKSQTIQFYSQFANNNKEIIDFLTSIK